MSLTAFNRVRREQEEAAAKEKAKAPAKPAKTPIRSKTKRTKKAG